MITENELKERVAKNLIRYRKANNLTQLQVAEKLNYSDKSISKWERKEGLPDLLILSNIAEMYGITLNDLLSDRKKLVRPKHKLSKFLITLIAFTSAWFIATVCFVALGIFAPDLDNSWLAFIYAIPVSLLVVIVFAKLWGNKFHLFISVSLLSWSIPLSIFLSFDYLKLWLLFIAIIPLQIITLLWFLLVSKKPLPFNKQ